MHKKLNRENKIQWQDLLVRRCVQFTDIMHQAPGCSQECHDLITRFLLHNEWTTNLCSASLQCSSMLHAAVSVAAAWLRWLLLLSLWHFILFHYMAVLNSTLLSISNYVKKFKPKSCSNKRRQNLKENLSYNSHKI